MAERKSSTTGPENEGKDMTNMGQTEEGRGSSTSPAPMDVDELEKVAQMATNVGTLNREEDKEEYEIFAVNEEENPEATISIKHGQAIDIGFQFLIEKMENSPNQYHICTYTPALLVHNFQRRKAKIMERVKLMESSLPNITSKANIDKVDLSFFVLYTSNHWHLLVVDVKKKRATSYNSIKGSARYMAAAKRWVTLLDAFFKFCGIMDDPLELVYDDQCPDQSSDSADCALFVIKFMETISRKGEIEWKFSQADMPLIRAQFAIEILTHASAKSLTM
ncbi:hypothetical protein Taro_034236 [Colocasia esculenta]|uniref:Ubiquitin-like protease family profile domain-containing protein n=1 Tax=Colocasia esculenta TaxID=4460 RepID=A0A843W708_COLES|nr:hypothetical protein [Colocasia esculenta]